MHESQKQWVTTASANSFVRMPLPNTNPLWWGGCSTAPTPATKSRGSGSAFSAKYPGSQPTHCPALGFSVLRAGWQKEAVCESPGWGRHFQWASCHFGVKLYIPASALGFDYLSLEVCIPVMFGSASSKGLPNLASFTFIKSGLFVLRICILYAFFSPL